MSSVRKHFCTVVRSGAGGCSRPRKNGISGCIPAVVRSVERSSARGISEAEERNWWPFDSKKARNPARSSPDVCMASIVGAGPYDSPPVTGAAETAEREAPAEPDVRSVGPWRQAIRRFRRQRLGVAALLVLVVIFAAGALASVVATVISFPALLVLLAAFSTLRGLGLKEIGAILVVLLWTSVARVVRASFLSLREREYVEAARAMGASDVRIMLRHLLPNSVGPIIVVVTSVIGQAILLEATVDFFGYGIYSAVTPTLGSLVADSLRDLGTTSWWLYTFPTAAIVTILLCVNYVGDSLDRALNPRA